MAKTLRCTCGVESDTHDGGSLGDVERQTGFGFVFDVSNGLTPIWLCPSCAEKVRAAWASIIEVTKTDMISLSGLLGKSRRKATGEDAADGDATSRASGR